MHADLPSLTAMAVSFARGVATVDEGAPGAGLDPIARRLLPLPVRAALDAVTTGARLAPASLRAVRVLSLGLVDHLEMRSLAIDAVTRDALRAGATQLVILGAGLDARAWRLPEAARARTFEVDHPATQRYKRERAGEAAGDVRFVAVDFEHDSLDARLAEAGHDSTARSVWIWEGVTPYLPREAIEETLRVVGHRSARGSTLAMTYVTPSMVNLPSSLRPIVRRSFALLGEPLRGLVSTGELGAMLDAVGLRVAADTGIADWIARYQPAHPARVRVAERLALALA